MTSLRSRTEKALANLDSPASELAGLLEEMQARCSELEGALRDIGEYTGDGPASAHWRVIVKSIGKRARAALKEPT